MRSHRFAGVALVGLGLLLAGCGMKASKEAAETTATKLYQAWSNKDWDAVLGLYSPQFYQETKKEQWRSIILGLHEKLGDYKSHQLKDWNYKTFYGTGGNTQTTVLIYEVRYTHGQATETLTFMGNGTEKVLKIAGHHITSPALLPTVSDKSSSAGAAQKGKNKP
jgi:hypothetical protein